MNKINKILLGLILINLLIFIVLFNLTWYKTSKLDCKQIEVHNKVNYVSDLSGGLQGQ